MFSIFKDGIEEQKSKLQAQFAELEQLKQDYEHADSAPLPREDFADMICESIDAQSADYGDYLMKILKTVVHKPKANMTNYNLFQMWPGASSEVKINTKHLFGLFAEPMKEVIREHIMVCEDYPEDEDCGPPRHERPRILAELDAKIGKLEQSIAKALAEAEAAGLNVAKLKPAGRPEKERFAGGKPLNGSSKH